MTQGQVAAFIADHGFTEASFAPAPVALLESGPGIELDVELLVPRVVPVSVSFAAAGGSATAGVDYQLAAGPLVFAPGEKMASLSLTPIDDGIGDPGESVVITLTGAINSTIVSPDSVTLILDEAFFFDGFESGDTSNWSNAVF